MVECLLECLTLFAMFLQIKYQKFENFRERKEALIKKCNEMGNLKWSDPFFCTMLRSNCVSGESAEVWS